LNLSPMQSLLLDDNLILSPVLWVFQYFNPLLMGFQYSFQFQMFNMESKTLFYETLTWQHILWFVKFLHNVDIYTFIVYLLEEADHQSSDPRSQITNHRSQYITLKNWNNHIVLIRVIAFTPFLPDEKGEMYLSDG